MQLKWCIPLRFMHPTSLPRGAAATSQENATTPKEQKEGKKRLKSFGQVEIPQKAFLSVLEAGADE